MKSNLRNGKNNNSSPTDYGKSQMRRYMKLLCKCQGRAKLLSSYTMSLSYLGNFFHMCIEQCLLLFKKFY